MTHPVRRQQLVPDLTEWFAEAFPPLVAWRTAAGPQGIRVEAHLDDGEYVVRAELPGIDPDKDLQVTVQRGVLTIRAERSEEEAEKKFTEFRYGTFARSIRLPEGASEDRVHATYQDGILTVRVGVTKRSEEVKKIPITKET